MDLAFAVVAAGIAAIVASDGSLGWRIVRVLATIAIVELSQRLHRAHRFGGIVTAVVGVVAIAIGAAFGPRYAAFGSWGLSTSRDGSRSQPASCSPSSASHASLAAAVVCGRSPWLSRCRCSGSCSCA